MPEGHTIHRLARQHHDAFAGQRVRVDSPQGRFPGASAIDGTTFERAEAYGKHLFHHYAGGDVVHVHLGLFGRFPSHRDPDHPPRDTVRYRIIGDQHAAHLVGATACELLTPDEVEALVDRLGPDPLRPDAQPDRAWAALQRRRVGIGRALMDQAVVAGIGNVYRAEVLFVHGVHPLRPANEIDRDTFDAMWDWLVEAMRRGVRSGRIVTVTPEELGKPRSRAGGTEGRYVYKRDVCVRCGTEVRRWDLAGRWAYACETCQPG